MCSEDPTALEAGWESAVCGELRVEAEVRGAMEERKRAWNGIDAGGFGELAGCGKTLVLYQGTTLVVPQMIENTSGFSP
jgi:hypothetical protein